MQTSKLWQVFSLLTTEDYLRVDKWLDSPVFNHREDLRRLWEVLRNASAPPSPQMAWDAIAPQEPFQSADFNRCCSRLTQQLERYLCWQDSRLESEPEDHHLALAEAFKERRNAHFMQLSLGRAERSLLRQPLRHDKFFFSRFQIEQLRYNAQSLTQHRTSGGLQEMSDAMDTWFVLQKLKQACSQIAQRQLGEPLPPLGFLEEVLEKVGQHAYPDIPAIQIYYSAYQMLAAPDGEPFFLALKALLADSTALLPLDELRSVNLMAINFCVQQLNRGVAGTLEEVYALYLRGLEEKWLFESGKLSPWTFKNVVSAGLKLHQFEGVAQFLEQYKGSLPEEIQQTHYRYNLAELQFARGDFRLALQSLAAVIFRDPLTELRARSLQIKAAYELEEMELVDYQLENLRKFLGRKRQLGYHRDHYREFERLTRQLVGLGHGLEAARRLADEIQAAPHLVERAWLLAKVQGG